MKSTRMKNFVALVAAAFALFLMWMTAAPAQTPPPAPDPSLLVLTCDEASQAALREGLHVSQCRRYTETIEEWKAVEAVTVKTEQGKFIVTLHYYKSPWWASGIEVVRA